MSTPLSCNGFSKIVNDKLGTVKSTVTDCAVCSWPWQWILLDKGNWLSLVCHH